MSRITHTQTHTKSNAYSWTTLYNKAINLDYRQKHSLG